jgi:hypothetical protein
VAALAVGAALLAGAQDASAAPSNDAFASAEPLSGASASISGTTVGATLEAGEPNHFAGNGSVWYAWTPPASGVVTLDVCNSAFAAKVQLYQGTALNALTEVGQRYPFPTPQCSVPNGSDLNFYPVTAGLPYRISVIEYSSDTTFTLNLSEAAGPANDFFANATDLGSPSSARVAGTTANASVEPGENGYSSDPAGNESVWYRFREPRDTPMWIDTCGATYPYSPPTASLYRGSSLGSLTPVQTDLALTPEQHGNCRYLWGVDDGAEVSAFTARAGTTYYVQLLRDNVSTQEEPFHLGLRLARFDGSISQKASSRSVRKGRTVTFNLVFRNRGDLPMSPAIDIAASKPNHLGRVSRGTRYVSFKPSRGQCKKVNFFGVIPGAICNPGNVKPGESVTIRAKVRAGSPFQELAEIDYLHGGEGDNNDDNPKNSDTVQIVKVRGGGHG